MTFGLVVASHVVSKFYIVMVYTVSCIVSITTKHLVPSSGCIIAAC